MVYVPLVGSSSPQGVIEIHGMLPANADVSEYKAYQRSAVALKAMIQAKEYKSVPHYFLFHLSNVLINQLHADSKILFVCGSEPRMHERLPVTRRLTLPPVGLSSVEE